MRKKIRQVALFAGIIACLSTGSTGWAAEDPLISLSVQQTEMSDVLKFIAAQSGTSVVMAPDVSTLQLTLDLQEVPLSECLDVILKPHGYGYRRIGKTIVVDKLEGLKELTELEPLQTKVFKLSYLNANDVLPVVEGVLTPRGSVKAIKIEQMAGWAFAEAGEEASEAGKRERQAVKMPHSSKTIIVQDVPESISSVASIISEIDLQPNQIEIRAYFVELTGDAIKDIGVDWAVAKLSGGIQTGGLTSGGTAQNTSSGTYFGDSALDSQAVTDLADSGMLFGIVNEGTDFSFDMWLAAVQGDTDVNILSAPRVLAQENQEASILVGKRTPIVSSETRESGSSTTTTTELEYYEQIGIQLNVVPQVCKDGLISMVVHPVVTEELSTKEYFNSGDLVASYPVIQTREAETRLQVENGETVALGGLISDSKKDGVNKVPLLGDIPYLGRLFRRDTTYNQKTELVIFLSATIEGTKGADGGAFNEAFERSEDRLVATWKPILEEDISAIVEPIDLPAVEVEAVEAEPAVDVEPAKTDVEDIMQDLTAE